MSTQTKQKPAKQPKEPKQPKEKPVLVDFTSSAPSEILTSEGTLNTADVDAWGYDRRKHESLGRADFQSEALWLTYKANRLRQQGQAMIQKADQMTRDAETSAKFGDPKKRAQMKKMQKLAKAFATLKESLVADGVDVDQLNALLGES